MANVREGRSADFLPEVKAGPGQNVTLPCHTSTNATFTKLEWNRTGLERYVFVFSDNKPYESIQDQRYRGRVQLKDPKMKNGNYSVLLKNVNIDDTGTYKCWVITHSNNRRKRNVREFVNSVHLSVSEGPEKEINDEQHQYGDANDEQPEGPRGRVGLGVGLGQVSNQPTKNRKQPSPLTNSETCSSADLWCLSCRNI
ncbi:V-set domain containing T-cell activation inhibitor 1 [Dissostichus eleginoides]|uniref:V-set domain containing T-cell activation inhibitor 1 n=1 Tax=Dissostichus eleginoides TaxID=100907 RepID=A0AAD9BVT8_DISEL|nr:V-set domain containing T-cell activation inhibitor 1 [Dissostichus eleginoides]